MAGVGGLAAAVMVSGTHFAAATPAATQSYCTAAVIRPEGRLRGSDPALGDLMRLMDLMGPMDLPNQNRIAALRDPQGAAFAVAEGPTDD